MQIEHMPMVRVFFEKTGRARYTSHLDIMRTLTRALRRSGLPLWYTQGFNPHLYMTFALPIALGLESLCESVDLRMTREMDCGEVVASINRVLPPGLRATAAAPPVHDPGEIAWADYRISLQFEDADTKSLWERLDAFLAQESIQVTKRTKKGEKQVDIRPLVQLLEAAEQPGGLRLGLRAAAGTSVNIAPALLLEAFYAWCGARPSAARVTREAILCKNLQKFA